MAPHAQLLPDNLDMMDLDDPTFLREVNAAVASVRKGSDREWGSLSHHRNQLESWVAGADLSYDDTICHEVVKQLIEEKADVEMIPVSPMLPFDSSRLTYVCIDTNIFISHLQFLSKLLALPESRQTLVTLLIPWIVIEELDSMKDRAKKAKNGKDSLSDRATQALKVIHGSLKGGAKFTRAGTPEPYQRLRGQRLSECVDGSSSSNDTRIVDCCLWFSKNKPGNVVLLSNDLNLRNKAAIHGIPAVAKTASMQTQELIEHLKSLGSEVQRHHDIRTHKHLSPLASRGSRFNSSVGAPSSGTDIDDDTMDMEEDEGLFGSFHNKFFTGRKTGPLSPTKKTYDKNQAKTLNLRIRAWTIALVYRISLEVLYTFMLVKAEENLGPDWIYVVKIPPPWKLSDILRLFETMYHTLSREFFSHHTLPKLKTAAARAQEVERAFLAWSAKLPKPHPDKVEDVIHQPRADIDLSALLSTLPLNKPLCLRERLSMDERRRAHAYMVLGLVVGTPGCTWVDAQVPLRSDDLPCKPNQSEFCELMEEIVGSLKIPDTMKFAFAPQFFGPLLTGTQSGAQFVASFLAKAREMLEHGEDRYIM